MSKMFNLFNHSDKNLLHLLKRQDLDFVHNGLKRHFVIHQMNKNGRKTDFSELNWKVSENGTDLICLNYISVIQKVLTGQCSDLPTRTPACLI